MLSSCKYCGRVHDKKIICPPKKKALEKRWASKNPTLQKFRKSNKWTEKSRRIRERDKYLCLCCLAGIKGTVRQINGTDLSVHHITPLEEDYDQRLDDGNLITVCRMHHEMCERGEITRQRQRELAAESMDALNFSDVTGGGVVF